MLGGRQVSDDLLSRHIHDSQTLLDAYEVGLPFRQLCRGLGGLLVRKLDGALGGRYACGRLFPRLFGRVLQFHRLGSLLLGFDNLRL